MHLLVSLLYLHQNARCNDKKKSFICLRNTIEATPYKFVLLFMILITVVVKVKVGVVRLIMCKFMYFVRKETMFEIMYFEAM